MIKTDRVHLNVVKLLKLEIVQHPTTLEGFELITKGL